MTTYLAEAYVPRGTELRNVTERVRGAVQELAAGGVLIRYVRSTFVPEDEVCFCLFEAASSEAVSELGTRAGLGKVRVVEAIGVDD